MNKIFYGLLFFTVIGLGVLFWLMKTLPSTPSKGVVAEEKVGEHEGEGVKIVGEEEKTEGEGHEGAAAAHGAEGAAEHGAEHGAEHAKAGEHGAEHAEGATEKAHEHGEKAPHAEAHEEHGAEHAEAKEPAEHSAEHGAGHDAERAKAHAGKSLLALSTEPVPAKVFINGKALGSTPLEIPLKAKAQHVKLVAPGYEAFTREAPPASEEAETLTWKVQLKAGEEKAAHAHTAKSFAAVEPGSIFGHGKLGPAFLQLKAVDASSPPDELVKNIRALLGSEIEANVIACRVDLGQRGKWNRILVGPVKSRSKAKAMIEPLSEKLKTRFPEFESPIVTGMQECGS